jgi:hypothetical protein
METPRAKKLTTPAALLTPDRSRKGGRGRGLAAVSQSVMEDGEGPGTHGPSPDARIATAPASAWMHQKLTPATALASTVRLGHPAIRAPASYRVAVVAGSHVAISTARHPDPSRFVQGQRTC